MNKENATRKQTTAEIIGDIPGGVHLLTIRMALKQGHAAVMIGAGFSLNAKGGTRLPLWAKLIDGLLDDIYPDGTAREKAKERFGGTSGMLRLADEYVAVQGRARLEAKLHQLLPDAGIVSPGDVHTKLLALNWTDVFTTNYDTLLERTLDADRSSLLPRIKSRYQVVVAAQDVPYSKRERRPRIIKLHGSLRSGSKLIVTEGDYREYPRDYAPFVNTVQQSMLENVFVLIGFSGDDPNFLAWTGWVRDHLEEKAPPLYLITFKPVPEGQRILLETRKIYPISIHELGKNKEEPDYGRALSKLLDFWTEDPPIRRVEWPYESVVKHWLPMRADVSQLAVWLTEVQRNRASYPGWIIAPADCRQRALDLSMLDFAVQAYEAMRPSLPLWLRLVFLDEVVWLTDITLNPLPERVENLIAGEFADGTSENEVSGPALPGTAEKLMVSPEKLLMLKANLAFALLRHAREGSDESAFLKWYERLSDGQFGKLSVDQQCALLYERILLKLENRAKADAFGLVHELDSLAAQAQDTYWPIRVGAVFGEVGYLHKAFDCVREGLRTIREAIQFDGESVELVSREQWAEWLYSTLGSAVKAAESLPKKANETQWSPEPGLRAAIEPQKNSAAEHSMDATGAIEEDTLNQSQEKVERDEKARDSIEHPTSIMDEVRFGVQEADRLLHASSISFDADEIPDSCVMPGLLANAKASALRFARLIERVSLPPVMGGIGYSARTVASCFRILATSGGQTASLRLLLRASDGLGGSLDVLDLATVSALEYSTAVKVFEHAVNAIGSIAVDMEWDSQGTAALKALMDLASRLAFRLEAAHAEELCEVAIRLHHSHALQRDYSLHMVYASFFRRAVRLLPRTHLRPFIPRILALVLVESNALPMRHLWPNPLGLVGAPSSDVEDKKALARLADEILTRLSTGKDASERTRYIGVLDWLCKAKLLTHRQTRLFAQQLWVGVAPDKPPMVDGFYRYAFLTWPTVAGRPERNELFKQWVAHLDVPDIMREEEMSGRKQMFPLSPNDQLISALTFGSLTSPPVQWSEAELLHLVSKVRAWWTGEGAALFQQFTENPYPDDTAISMLGRRIRGISYFCLRVLKSNLTLLTIQAELLDDWFAELWEASVLIDLPATALLFVGLHWWPDRADSVLDRIIDILESSSVSDVTADALQMAVEWICAHENPTAGTTRFVQYLVNGLRGGPDFLVEQKLRAVRELLTKASAIHVHRYLAPLRHSLCSLLDDLRSGAASRSRRVNFYATPLLRVAVSKTLASMIKQAPESTTDANWQAAANIVRTDPLLLVRNQLE